MACMPLLPVGHKSVEGGEQYQREYNIIILCTMYIYIHIHVILILLWREQTTAIALQHTEANVQQEAAVLGHTRPYHVVQ